MTLALLIPEPASNRGSGTYRKGSHRHRRLARVPINLLVDLWTLQGRRTARCIELGLATLVLDTGPPLAYGDSTEIVLPGAIRVSGTVRWSGAHGLGIQLAPLDATATRAVIDLIRRA